MRNLFLVVFFLLASCAPGPEPASDYELRQVFYQALWVECVTELVAEQDPGELLSDQALIDACTAELMGAVNSGVFEERDVNFPPLPDVPLFPAQPSG